MATLKQLLNQLSREPRTDPWKTRGSMALCMADMDDVELNGANGFRIMVRLIRSGFYLDDIETHGEAAFTQAYEIRKRRTNG